MTEMKFSAALGDEQTDGSHRFGPMGVGVLLVGIGVAMLAERTGLLPSAWRLLIWPVLLMAFGVARLVMPARRGRRGLFFVLAGAWWFAGLQGWLLFEQTWPLLIVFFGASVVVQAATAQPGVPREAFPRRHDGGMTWVLTAILIGTFISAGGGSRAFRNIVDTDSGRMMAIAGRTEHHVQETAFELAETLTIMGKNVIDLRDLPAAGPSIVTVDGLTAMGSTIVRVPPGWTVDIKAVAIMGRASDRRSTPSGAERTDDWSGTATVPDAAAATGPPRHLVVRGAVIMGSLAVTR